jgi:class 3 adenylate cyclase
VVLRAQATATRIGAVELERWAHAAAHRVHKANGEHTAALAALERSTALSDSIHSIENAQHTARIEMEQGRRTRELNDRIARDREEAQERRTALLRNASIGALVLSVLLAGSVYIGLARTRRERRRADNLLHNMLPASTVAELKEQGRSMARRHDRATVLFADVAGFSAIAAVLEPEDLVHALNEHFSAYDSIMERHGVEKIKTIGDAYMAAGGMGNDPADAARRVVRAALEMQEHNSRQPPLANGMRFDLRIGIHTGPVVAGVLGTRKLAYDIWGDTVNIAARMESAGEAGRVNISSATYVLVHEQFRCTRRGRIEARSIGPVIMYFVEGPVNGEAPSAIA